jgi:hypothetical protein
MIRSAYVNWWRGYTTLLIDRAPKHPEDIEPLKKMLREQVKGMYYNPIPFQEFKDIPPLRHYPHQRLEAIKDRPNLPFLGNIVVDIGANMGYYSFMAAELGASQVIPIETYVKSCEVIERVAKIYGFDRINTWSQNVTEFPFDKVKPDVVLAFSVLPYLGQPNPEPLTKVLRSMAEHAGVCYIEMGDGGSELSWCQGDQAFKDLFLACGFQHVEAIGQMNSTHANTKRTLWECRGAE